MIIDLDLYRVFVSVATNGSFSKAAEELNVTQSAISQAIQKIEKIFEKELFVRSRQGVMLTSFGSTLLEKVQPSISELDNVYEDVSNQMRQDVITIGASSTICQNLILPIIKSSYENKHFYLESLLSDKEKIRAVESGKFDFAIINDYNLPLDSGLYKKKLLTLEYGFYYNPEKLHLDEKKIFSNTLILKNSGTKGRVEFNKKFYGLPFKFQNVLELSHDDIIVEATRLGLGIGFCPDIYVPSSLKKLDIKGEPVRKSIVIIYQQKSEIIEDFINKISNYRS